MISGVARQVFFNRHGRLGAHAHKWCRHLVIFVGSNGGLAPTVIIVGMWI